MRACDGLVLAVLATLVATMLGCTARIGDLTVVSTRPVVPEAVNLDTLPQHGAVGGRDVTWILLFVPLGFPTLADAVDDALAKGDVKRTRDRFDHGGP